MALWMTMMMRMPMMMMPMTVMMVMMMIVMALIVMTIVVEGVEDAERSALQDSLGQPSHEICH